MCVTYRLHFSLLLADLDKDGFLYRCDFQRWIKSKDNKFLILNEKAEFQCHNLSIQEQECHSGEAQQPIWELRAIPRLTLKTAFYVVMVVLAQEVLALKVLDLQELILHNISTVAVKMQHFGTLKHFENTNVCGHFLQKTNFTSAFTRTRTQWDGWG